MHCISARLTAAGLVVMVPLAVSAQEVRNRQANQQRRIEQGVASGQVTARDAANLEGRESRIYASRRADRVANGGHLTAAERDKLNPRENAASAHVYTDKHDDVTQPGVVPR